MTASLLKVLFDWVYLASLAAWVGSGLFLAFVAGPSLKRLRGNEVGAAVIRAIVPRYCLWGAIAASVALPAAVAVPLCYPELRGPWVGGQALVIIAAVLAMLYLGNSLAPALIEALAAGPSGEAAFMRLWRRAVVLNGAVVVVGLGLLLAFAARPAPTSSGIIEPSPVERARRESLARPRPPGPPVEPPSSP